jgi:hypothetical protein
MSVNVFDDNDREIDWQKWYFYRPGSNAKGNGLAAIQGRMDCGPE